MTNHLAIKAAQDLLYAEHKKLAAVVRAYPRAANGLVLDSAKTEAYAADKRKAQDAFEAIQRFNAANKAALKEMRKRG